MSNPNDNVLRASKARLTKLQEMMNGRGKVDERTTLLKFCFETGLSLRTAKEYHAMLVAAGALKS
jgi:hypothetical protein